MRTKLFFIILACHSCLVFSQKESANWYFGDFAGLNFISGTPVPLVGGNLVTSEGCATISDFNGNLLFYSDGVTVWDKRHEVMPNGEGLLGHSSSTESALIVPKPGSISKYYLFTIDKPSYFLTDGLPIDGVNYSEIDMSLNEGFGDIIVSEKNKHLITYDVGDPLQNEFKSSEKITAVAHSNGSSIWVITQFMNKFYSFLVDVNGVNESPIVSTVTQTVRPVFNLDGVNITAIGYLKVSPNGKKIAIAHSSTIATNPKDASTPRKSGKVLLYDFNNATGIVANEKKIIDRTYPYGVEFSPNSKLLYLTDNVYADDGKLDGSNLFQYNLENSDISASQRVISSSNNNAGALQLAINGKIYRAGYSALSSDTSSGLNISVINEPNKIGSDCDYSHNSVSLGGKTSQIGLPPFVQSIFLYSFDYENICLGEQTHFEITSESPYDSVTWDFGDGQTSNMEEPLHTYSQSGVYIVSLTITLNGVDQEPLLKQVIISEPPAVLQTTFDLVQCDSFDANPNDGQAVFNLQLANPSLTLFTSEPVQVYYYNSLQAAIDDTGNTNALNNIYSNQSQGEILYAKVFRTNTDCFSLATISLSTTQSVDINAFELGACDPDEDGFADFYLEFKGIQIASTLNLPANVTVSFYENKNDASIGVHALPSTYNSSNSMLYVRAESDNVCYGTGTLNLLVKSFPQLEDKIIDVCLSDFPVAISSGLNINQLGNYNYQWNTNEISEEISVSQAGTYEVTVIDPILNCDDTVTITVNQMDIPVIQDLMIDNFSMNVLLTTPSENFVYAIDDQFGVFQESNLFTGLPAGTHTLYIKDFLNCNIISEEFYILGFPKYFTPNDDGDNDTWNVEGLDPSEFQFQTITMKIYDRYGKLLKTFNPYQSQGWNGRYNGKLLSSDDYWYHLILPDGRKYSGHFSLKV